ncbi:MAG: aminoglycoside 3'-phosphotransferase [Firmicutes bacterium]|nr:aminoglycoside 3'-phosphotransferase [Bacillota bacterium]
MSEANRIGDWRVAIPRELERIIGGAVWERDTMGCSSSAVYKLRGISTGGNAYLKVQRRTDFENLRHEKEILHWLSGHLLVPQVLRFIECDEMQYLLVTEIPGLNCVDCMSERDLEEVVRMFAGGLRMIHSLDIPECPFDRRLDVVLGEALDRVEAGVVDEADLEPENTGRAARDIYDELVATKPLEEDLVFTHGDYCLPNVIVSDSGISGFVDWGRAGVADRYQDLALAARSLKHNAGPRGGEMAALFFHEYGVEDVDVAKVQYYILLDELY